MKFLESFKKAHLTKRTPTKLAIPSPEIEFFVPEGAIPDGELTIEQQAEAEEYQRKLHIIIGKTVAPYTQMLHLASSERDKRGLGEILIEEKGILETPYDYSFLGLTIAHGVHKKEVVTRTKKQTGWDVEKPDLTKSNKLIYWKSADDSFMVDRFESTFTDANGSEIGSLDLQYDPNQQLKTAMLKWIGISPRVLDRLMSENEMSVILHALAEPQSAVIRTIEKGLLSLGSENPNKFGGAIRYGLENNPTINLDLIIAPLGRKLSSIFEYKPVPGQKFVRRLTAAQLLVCDSGDLSTRRDIPAQLALLGLNSMLSMIKPERFTKG